MKIAMIDDRRPSRKELVHQILSVLPDSRIEEVDDGAGALELISAQSSDLLSTDTNLNDVKGTTLAVTVRCVLPGAQIVLATAYPQYAVKAFELSMNNYISKPFDPNHVRKVLEKCQLDLKHSCPAGEDVDSPPGSLPVSRLAVNIDRTTVLLDIHRITYIEIARRSCVIHTMDGDYTKNQLLEEYEKGPASCGFCRIHKGYLVNLNHITEMSPWANNGLAVEMIRYEKDILPVGRERVKSLRQALGI